ncbi:NAD(P)/FAD-dependent oxidoreductase [Campylobacter geochelonis]|uniref:NAD(P)/FAD-dependent oxidoreductase n=1 Tax=Campylobacter geochelonis TaxID=1780362 RepID=UPI0007707616|nr:NAD(P)/FAD-dependent oxidoreductase [Campylobacter geochelonis]CZE51435.1 geranylgeranyl reductase family [Campylobacter geochelonis]
MYDVVIIGAGPSGSTAAAFCHNAGLKVRIVEKSTMPKFVIGESLLANCNNILEEAGLLEVIENHSFQYKNGAAFSWRDEYTYFDFLDKSSAGAGTTFQVQRAEFDKLLVDEVIKKGVEVSFNTEVVDAKFSDECATLIIKDENENKKELKAKFILDASGYGRVLPRILNLEKPSTLPVRTAYFTHIEDNITEPLYDRNKILITTHPTMRDVWFWLIPFSNGRCSIGVVGEKDRINPDDLTSEITLKTHVYKAPMLKRLLNNASWDMEVKTLNGYSKDVKALYGKRFALLGNATEFLDPVFSSGVTIALYSSKLASKCLIKTLKNEDVDWEKEYKDELMLGVNAFRTYVNGWYDGAFQDVIYTKNKNIKIKRMISSILAGYAWDRQNPFVVKSDEKLKTLAAFC